MKRGTGVEMCKHLIMQMCKFGLMMLYEHGKFLLDDPVSMYIPEFKNTQVLVTSNDQDSIYTTRPAKTAITIRQLLSHTSGIPYGNSIYSRY
ncbi:MAG: beta-lactamase family protein, partial [Ferruginibacter sp.]|nr:beta-lactamase family protein [Ferruginibacter sp.]